MPVFERLSAPESASELGAGGMLNEAILSALIGINQIETQTCEWRSVMLVSSLPKLGNESRLCPEAQIAIYSTVEYTIEYIALRSEFCTLNLIIFESGQNQFVG